MGCKFYVLAAAGHLLCISSQCPDNPGKEIRTYGQDRIWSHGPRDQVAATVEAF